MRAVVDLPDAVVDALRAAGLTTFTVTVDLTGSPAPSTWPTIAEAAREHAEHDMRPARDAADARRLLDTARKRIVRAIDAGQLGAAGPARRRVLDPARLAAWRLVMRDRDANRG